MSEVTERKSSNHCSKFKTPKKAQLIDEEFLLSKLWRYMFEKQNYFIDQLVSFICVAMTNLDDLFESGDDVEKTRNKRSFSTDGL